ncbi:MAG: hypothetical protein ABI091_31595 [Ferruginibacter sp.]
MVTGCQKMSLNNKEEYRLKVNKVYRVNKVRKMTDGFTDQPFDYSAC